MTENKAKKYLAKVNAKKSKVQLDTHSLKVKTVAVVKPVQGVSVSNYINQFFKLMTATDPWGWTQSSDYSVMKYQYDQVRVNRMRVLVTPKANVFDQANAQNDSTLTLTGDGMVHTAIDRDSATPSNIAAMARYASYRRYRVDKKFSRTYQISWPKGVWLDTENPYADTQLLQQVGANGGVGLYAENLVEDAGELFNEPWAEITFLYDIVLRGKVTPNTGIDASGNIILYAPTSLNLLPQSDCILIGGGLNGANNRIIQDASGNYIGQALDEFNQP